MTRIGMLGAGSWGPALAILLSTKNFEITLWEYFPDLVEKLKKYRENKSMLPGIKIPSNIQITNDISEAV